MAEATTVRAPLYITMHECDNVAIVANDGGLPAGTTFASGLVLDQLMPGVEYTRGTMQIAHMVHAVATILMMAMFLGHIYMGTIGMRGAYRAMRDGYVDEAWAGEHHELWLEDIRAGRVPAQRSARPAPPPRPIASA